MHFSLIILNKIMDISNGNLENDDGIRVEILKLVIVFSKRKDIDSL